MLAGRRPITNYVNKYLYLFYIYLDDALIVGLGGEVGEDPGRLEDGGGVVTCNDDGD